MKKFSISRRFLQTLGLGVVLGTVLTLSIAKVYNHQIAKIWAPQPVMEQQ